MSVANANDTVRSQLVKKWKFEIALEGVQRRI